MAQTYKEPGWKKVIDRIGSAILMNSLFLICCIPVVTIGNAWCGLYSASRAYVREEKWFQAFKEGVGKQFLPTALVWVISLLVGGYMLVNTATIAYYRTEGFVAPLVVSGIMTAFALMFMAAMLPVRVYNTTNTTQWIKNAVTLVFRAPLQSFLVAVLMWLPVVLIPAMLMFGAASLLLIMSFYYTMAAMIAIILYKKPLAGLFSGLEEEVKYD